MATIYILREPDGGPIRYVGKTVRKLSNRLRAHLKSAEGTTDTCHRIRWIQKLMREGAVPEMTEVGPAPGDGGAWEIAWIKYFRDEGADLVNSTDGGEGFVGYKWTPEARARHAEAHWGLVVSQETRDKIAAANTGKHPTAETLAKMSAAKKDKPRTPAQIEANKNRPPVSEATKNKMRRIMKGRVFSPSWRANISAGKMGHAVSSETLAKMSAARKGKPNPKRRGLPVSNEQRARISAALKRQWADPVQKAQRHAALQAGRLRAKLASGTDKEPRSEKALANLTAASRRRWADPVWREGMLAKFAAARAAKKAKAPGHVPAEGPSPEVVTPVEIT